MAGKAEDARRANFHYMADAMRRLEWDLHQTILTQGRIPEDWHAIAREAEAPGKVRVTIRLDSDVVRFFKAQGANWQPRLNRVLRAWMHARLAGLIRGAETMDYLKAREGAFDGEKPRWGDQHATLAEALGEDSARDLSEEAGVPLGEERPSFEDRLAEYARRVGPEGAEIVARVMRGREG